MRDRLRLELRPEPAQPTRVREGVDFVGWRTWSTHRVARRQTLATLAARLAAFERHGLQRAFGGDGSRIEIRPRRLLPPRRPAPLAAAGDVSRLGATLASYSGHLRHGAAGRDWVAIRAQFAWLPFLFAIDGWRVRARWRASSGDVGWWVSPSPRTRTQRSGTRTRTRSAGSGASTCTSTGTGTEGRSSQVTSLRARTYRRLAASADADVLVFATVGRYVEFFGPQRVLAQWVLGLRPVPIARFGWGLTAGFPVWHAARFAQRALAAGVGAFLPPRRSRRGAVLMVPCGAHGDGALR